MGRRAIRVAPGEMALLNMLWVEGPLTLREAHERFVAYGDAVTYPTMQARLNRLAEKRLVMRSKARPAKYNALATRDQVTLGHLRELIAKLGRGNVVPLVAHLLAEQSLTDAQINELQRLLATARRNAPTSKKRR
jgi:BlaI family transcriptional regulator, penicillinase repressor